MIYLFNTMNADFTKVVPEFAPLVVVLPTHL